MVTTPILPSAANTWLDMPNPAVAISQVQEPIKRLSTTIQCPLALWLPQALKEVPSTMQISLAPTQMACHPNHLITHLQTPLPVTLGGSPNPCPTLPDLPKCLCMKLPIGALAVKQKHREKLMALWKYQWSKSMHFNHLSHIDSSTPSKNFMCAIGYLPKTQAGTMYQLHLGHITLNKHLHRINRSDTLLYLQCEAV